MEDEPEQQIQTSSSIDDRLQLLRSKATELLLQEKWTESIQIYSQLLDFCRIWISQQDDPDSDHLCRFRKTLCLARSNRAEARFRLRDHAEALRDCDEALKIDGTHFKALFCKGKILLHLNRYSMALSCFKSALLDPQSSGNLEILNAYVEKCKKLEIQSRTGGFDLSDWVLNGFRGKPPELGEYIGSVEIKRSKISGRGLFATKNVEVGTLLLVTKAITTERGIVLPGQDSVEHAQLVIWKNFIGKVTESVTTSKRTRQLIGKLSTSDDEEGLEVPCISFFKPETEESSCSDELDKDEVLSILDVNSLVEDAASSKILGKNCDYHGVGLWVLASFINHSCTPNARRLHIADYVIVHASRDIKAGEELTFMYFDALSLSKERKEMAKTWGIDCKCRRCNFEDRVCPNKELREIEIAIEGGMDVGSAIYKLEEGMRRWAVRGRKEKGFLRASFWRAYSDAYGSDRTMKRWGRRIPPLEVIVDSVVEAVGSEERVLKVAVEWLKKSGGGVMELERVMKLGRGVYSKAVKKQAMRSLLEIGLRDYNC